MKKNYPGPRWRPGSFLDNLTAAADAVGFENADLAFGLARVEWGTVENRDRFLDAITGMRSRDIIEEGGIG